MAFNDIFASTYHQFLSELSDKDKARYDIACTPDGLVSELAKICRFSKGLQGSRLQKTLAAVEGFNDRTRSFFAVVDSSVTQGCVFSGAALGAVRLILEMASHFPNFFNKLIAHIEDLTESFPRYAALEEICRGRPIPRIIAHLGCVYRDLFEFFHGAVSVFTSSSGRVKRPPELIANIIWRPFDERFKAILSRMSRHSQLLFEELQILQLGDTANLGSTLEKVATEADNNTSAISDIQQQIKSDTNANAVRRIREWLDPPAFATVYHQSVDRCEQGTAQWLFSMEQFRKFSSSTRRPSPVLPANLSKADDRVLWIHGNPGAGKSILAAATIRELQSRRLSDGTWPDVYYFFFKDEAPFHKHRSQAYQAILAQILHKHRDNQSQLDKFIFAAEHDEKSSGQSTATTSQLEELLNLSLVSLVAPVLILDGIDECGDPSEFVGFLKRRLFRIPDLKMLIFSRPTVLELTRFVQPAQKLAFGQEAVNEDIRLFSMRHLNDLLQDGLLHEHADLEKLADKLVLGADRMFLWARLMVSLLRSPALSPSQRESIIHSITLPEGLDFVYTRIFRQISQLDVLQRRMAVRIISWTLFCTPRLTAGDWRTLLQLEEDSRDEESLTRTSELFSLVTCGLVSFGPSYPAVGASRWDAITCSFVHLSVSEYLSQCKSWDLSFPHLYPEKSASNMEIAKDCLDNLLRAAPQTMPFPVNGAPTYAGPTVTDLRSRLTEYASAHWLSHLDCAIPRDLTGSPRLDSDRCLTAIKAVCDSLEKLLDRPLAVAFWIESFYASKMDGPLELFGILKSGSSISCSFPAVLDWLAWVEGFPPAHALRDRLTVLKDNLGHCLSDLSELTAHWGQELVERPSMIWGDALLFTKSKYLPASQSAHMVDLNQNHIKPQGMSSRKLCHISATSADGRTIAVLSIWPSAQLETFWEKIDSKTAYAQVDNFCEGWLALYELLTVGKHLEPLGSLYIPLKSSEIRLQMRQGLRQEHFSSWKTSFPISISPDGHRISVLRTVYQVTKHPHTSTLHLQSCLIPIEDVEAAQNNWDESLKPFDPSYFLSKELPPTLMLLHRNLYTYRIKFSADSRYLLFHDKKRLTASNVVVFELYEDLGKPALRIRTTNAAPLTFTSSLVDFEQIIMAKFHPTLTILFLARKSKVQAWDFAQNILTELIEIDRRYSGEFSLQVSSFEFSACGNYVLVQRDSREDREVLDLRNWGLSLDSGARGPGFSNTAAPQAGTRMSKKLDEMFGPGAGGLVSHTGILSTGMTNIVAKDVKRLDGSIITKGSRSYLQLSSKGNLVLGSSSISRSGEIMMAEAGDGDLQLLHLPAAAHSKHPDITVRPPEKGWSHFPIIVNKVAEDGYDLMEQSSSSFPALIMKDVRSFLGAEECAAMSRGQLDQGLESQRGTKRRWEDYHDEKEFNHHESS